MQSMGSGISKTMPEACPLQTAKHTCSLKNLKNTVLKKMVCLVR